MTPTAPPTTESIITASAKKPIPLTDRIPILIDDREKLPWAFPTDRFTESAAHLVTGDYTIADLQNVIAIERKTLGDAVNTIIGQWLRFVKELKRLACMDVAAIVIEANVIDVISHRYESDAQPASVLGRLATITLDYGVHVFWWGSRQQSIELACQFLTLAYKRLRR